MTTHGRDFGKHRCRAVNCACSTGTSTGRLELVPHRTALIPEVTGLNVESGLVAFQLEQLALASEVWSSGNTAAKRRTKLASYLATGVERLWIVDLDDAGTTVTTHRLRLGAYTPENVVKPSGPDTVPAENLIHSGIGGLSRPCTEAVAIPRCCW